MFDTSSMTENQQLIANAIADIAKDYPHSHFMEKMKAGKFPSEFWKTLADGGYLGAMTQEAYGGSDFTAEDVAAMMIAMGQGGLASSFLTNHLVCCDALTRFGTEAQRKELIPQMVAGARWALADTERTDGRTLYGIQVTAAEDKGNFVLNGTKRYVANAEGASHFLVSARTGGKDAANSPEGVTLFLVPATTKGLSSAIKEVNVRVTMDREPISANGDAFFDVTFDKVSVPATNILGGKGKGGELLKTIQAAKMLLMAAVGVGWGDRIIDKGVAYANTRVIYEEPISSYQAIQHPMVLAKTDVEMAKLMVERAAQVFTTSTDPDELLMYASLAKQLGTEASFAACDIAIQSHGGSGFDRDNGLITLWPLILMSRMVPLSSATILERFAETEYGLPATR